MARETRKDDEVGGEGAEEETRAEQNKSKPRQTVNVKIQKFTTQTKRGRWDHNEINIRHIHLDCKIFLNI